MGLYDTDCVFEIPCLERIYVKNMEDGREYDILDHARYAGNEDALVMPGMVGFEGTIWAEWKDPQDSSVARLKWPALPPFVKREKIVLADEDRAWADEHPEVQILHLVNGYDDVVHVFYDKIGGTWEPEWEGLKSSEMRVTAYWESPNFDASDDLELGEIPYWVKGA